MPKFSSAKECLLHYGKIEKITRGRISADNHAFIAERIAAGDTVAGYESKVSTKPTGEIVHSNNKATASVDKNVIADIGEPTRNEDELEAYIFEDGKRVSVGMREVCAFCRASLTYCHCTTPHFRVDYDRTAPVYFRARTTPLKKGW